MLLMPLGGGAGDGTIYVARRRPLPFVAGEEKLLARLALLVGSALRSAEFHHRTQRALEELRRSHERMARVWDIHERLTERVLSGEGLPTLTEALAGLVHNPVLLEDREGRVLSWAPGPG